MSDSLSIKDVEKAVEFAKAHNLAAYKGEYYLMTANGLCYRKDGEWISMNDGSKFVGTIVEVPDE